MSLWEVDEMKNLVIYPFKDAETGVRWYMSVFLLSLFIDIIGKILLGA